MATFNPNQAVGPDGKPLSVRQPITPPPQPREIPQPPRPPSGNVGAPPPVAGAPASAAPTNPSFRAGQPSPQAQAWQNERTANTGPQRPAAAAPNMMDGLRSKASALATSRVGQMASKAASAVKPLVKGAGYLATGGAVLQATDSNSTERYAKRFGMDEPTGDGSLRDIGKFALMRGLGFASDLGNNLSGGEIGARYFADKQPGAIPEFPVPPRGAAQAAEAAQPVASAAQPVAAAAAPTAAPAAPSNVVVRNGNSFSGENVRSGFTYGGDGAPASAGQQGVNVLPAATFGGQDQGLRAMPASGPSVTSIGGKGLSQEANERFNNSPSFSVNFSGTQRQQAAAAAAQQGRNAQIMKSETDQGLLETQEAGENRRADLRSTVDMRGQDVTMRGQDVDAGVRTYAADSASRSAMAKSRSEAGKDDRDYLLKLQERLDRLGAQDLEQRQGAEKAWQSQLENRFMMDDGKGGKVPDRGSIAKFNTAIDSTIPALVDQLTKTGTPEAMAMAKKLTSEGRAAIDPNTADTLMRAFQRRELARKTDGWTYGSSTLKDSENLLGFLDGRTEPGMVGSDTVVTQNGTRIRADKLKYGPDGNVLLPNFGAPSDYLTGVR